MEVDVLGTEVLGLTMATEVVRAGARVSGGAVPVMTDGVSWLGVGGTWTCGMGTE